VGAGPRARRARPSDLRAVARAGLAGLATTAIGITTTLALGAWLGRRLGVRRDAALLVSLGTAICGGSAIAAAAPALDADSDDTAVALATVFLLNGVALVAFPVVGQALGMAPERFGLWAALAIHDTSSVVGAALAFGGPAALATATVAKLARSLWIAPVTALLRAGRRTRGRAAIPVAPFGFLVAAALGTFVAPLHAAAPAIAAGSRRLLVAALVLVGAGLSRRALRTAGARPLLLGALLWVAVGALTLAAIEGGLLP